MCTPSTQVTQQTRSLDCHLFIVTRQLSREDHPALHKCWPAQTAPAPAEPAQCGGTPCWDQADRAAALNGNAGTGNPSGSLCERRGSSCSAVGCSSTDVGTATARSHLGRADPVPLTCLWLLSSLKCFTDKASACQAAKGMVFSHVLNVHFGFHLRLSEVKPNHDKQD